MADQPSVSAVVLAYGEERYLADCIDSLLASDPTPEIVLVDNGAHEAVQALAPSPHVKIVRPEQNLGFAGGCHYGIDNSDGEVIVFINSDVKVAPDAISKLVERVADPRVGLASACVRLADDPTRVNSVGNPAQYLLFSWAGGLGDAASEHSEPKSITGVCGATFAMRRAVWDQLGGFDPAFFAYGEDLDLSLRAWQAGYQVAYVPDAVSWHWWEFGRNPLKMYLVERNRLIMLLTLYERRTLLQVLPIAAVVELGVMAMAVRSGWAKQKWNGWTWIFRHRHELAARRVRIQSTRVVSDAQLAPLLQGRIDPPKGFGFSIPPIVNRVLDIKWRWISRNLAKRSELTAGRS